MSLSNPTTKEIQDGDSATIKIEKPIRTLIASPIRKLVCLFKGHTEVVFQDINGQVVTKTCLRCWKKYR